MPKPVLQAMVLADHVYRDAATGKFIIAGTFGTIWRGQVAVVPDKGTSEVEVPRQITAGPVTQMGSPFLYFALVEVHGPIPLQLKFVDLKDATVLFEAECEVTSTDPVAVAEYVLPMPPLPTQNPGAFSLDLLYQGEILGSWRITVKNIPQHGDAET